MARRASPARSVSTGIRILADPSVMDLDVAATGANKDHTHLVGVVPNRDFTPDQVVDLRLARAGDPCPRCDGTLIEKRGIEVGHVFKLGTKYSKAMGCTFLDADGEEQPMIMGCYGLGVSRTMAAAIEQNHDDKGIIWPLPLAPYEVVLVLLNSDKEEVVEAAEELYGQLVDAGHRRSLRRSAGTPRGQVQRHGSHRFPGADRGRQARPRQRRSRAQPAPRRRTTIDTRSPSWCPRSTRCSTNCEARSGTNCGRDSGSNRGSGAPPSLVLSSRSPGLPP